MNLMMAGLPSFGLTMEIDEAESRNTVEVCVNSKLCLLLFQWGDWCICNVFI